MKLIGFQGLFKGNVAAEWLYVTYGASQFYAYYYLDSFLKTVSIHVVVWIVTRGHCLIGCFLAKSNFTFHQAFHFRDACWQLRHCDNISL